MSSSDSGRFSGSRSNFSQTCNLLSQYLKRNGSFIDPSLGLTQSFESKGAPIETMNLLPMIEESKNPNEEKTAQMTIFYAGQVIVFNDFSAEKAKEVMSLARKSSGGGGAQNHHKAAVSPPLTPHSPAESTAVATSTQNIIPTFGIKEVARSSPQPPTVGTDLPIKRKNSLARFLEKRKDRITANAPYQTSKPAGSLLKPVKAEPWLGLGSQFPHQMQ